MKAHSMGAQRAIGLGSTPHRDRLPRLIKPAHNAKSCVATPIQNELLEAAQNGGYLKSIWDKPWQSAGSASETCRRREVLGAIAVLSATRGELGDRGSNARVLPDNRVVHRLSTFLVPDDRGFALVRDPDRGQIFRPQPPRFHCFLDDTIRAAPNFLRIVLDPSRFGIDLLVLSLSCAHDASGTIEHYEARACRSLIN